MFLLSEKIEFPPIDLADEYGLLAIGGDLSEERLLLAYRSGIFPWYSEGEPICWFSPNPRFVLFPDELHVSKSMRQLLRKKQFRFSINKAFDQVIEQCSMIPRAGQNGTWITKEMEEAYKNLHNKGLAVSAEAWLGDKLVGGLYGIRLGKIFFGESMFSIISNASKFTFTKFVQQLKKEEVQLIDCQVYTAHLESLGARMIARNDFKNLLEKYSD